MLWNIVFFFWRYNISLISWNCQSRIWLSLPLPLPGFFLSFLSFFFFSLHLFLILSFLLLFLYFMIWNIVFFVWRYNISLISWNCQSRIWSSLPLPRILLAFLSFLFFSCFSFLYSFFLSFLFLDIFHDMKYRLLPLAI